MINVVAGGDGSAGRDGRRYGDRRTQLVVPLFEEGHDHVETVGGTALEDDDEDEDDALEKDLDADRDSFNGGLS